MCGILGLIDFANKPTNIASFTNALNLMKHRGPDGTGIKQGKNFLFGHRRLSIIDLAKRASQPMLSNDGEVVITYNGEIYNYQDIRKKLVDLGYKFKTSSDTEVILNAYIEFGISCLDDFIGMFAFAIFDMRRDECFIVRDRLGVKPVYYSKANGNLYFSSEVKSIRYLTNQNEINNAAIISYFQYRYPILGESFFKNIFALEPGTYIKISKDKTDIIKYWSIPKIFNNAAKSERTVNRVKQLNSLLKDSVNLRTIADVNVGTFLSGGVDSSIITKIVKNFSKNEVHSFCIGFENTSNSDAHYAKKFAKKINTTHHTIQMNPSRYIELNKKLVHLKDAPLSVPNEVAIFEMCEKLRTYVKVVLSGEGADELFGGYGRILRCPHDLKLIKSIDTLKLSNDEKENLAIKLVEKYGSLEFDHEVDHFLAAYQYIPAKIIQRLFNKIIDVENINTKLRSRFLEIFNEVPDATYGEKILYAFEKIHLQGLLQRLDTATMAASIEGRVPFVDHRLVEFAFSLPFEDKVNWISAFSENLAEKKISDEISEVYDIPKFILKESFKDEIDNEILFRKKVGFPVPLESWFSSEVFEKIKKRLTSKNSILSNYLDTQYLEKIIKKQVLMPSGKLNMLLWMLYNLEIFLGSAKNEQVID